jgi:hypothetical protein
MGPAKPSAGATAFGLDIRSQTPLLFLGSSSAAPTGRLLELGVHADSATAPSWPPSSTLICDERDAEGGVLFRIHSHPESGYLISGPSLGAHLLSVDGRRLDCHPAGCREDAWQRFVVAQVLPFAALLQGLEVFHASAVVLAGAAAAILGPSGAGKTSVALELCRLGASFLADDVLALETHDEGLLAHPGTQLAGLDHREARRLQSTASPRGEPVVAVNERERLLRMRGAQEPAPLAALFFLERRADGPARPRFEELADAPRLLSASFNFVLTTPQRLSSLLEVCALAARCRVETVLAGPQVDATQLAGAIRQRLESSS